MQLETERLILREFKLSDLHDAHAYNKDPRFLRFMPVEPQTLETTKAFLETRVAQQSEDPRMGFELAICVKPSDVVVGGIAIRIEEPGIAELGYALSHEHYGNGYITEAAQEMLAFAFNTCNVNRVQAWCDVENTASENVMKRLGMTYEGTLRQKKNLRGEWRDNKIYSILRTEFNNEVVS